MVPHSIIEGIRLGKVMLIKILLVQKKASVKGLLPSTMETPKYEVSTLVDGLCLNVSPLEAYTLLLPSLTWSHVGIAWITPSIFDSVPGSVDEYTLCQALGRSACQSRLYNHWKYVDQSFFLLYLSPGSLLIWGR